MNQPEKTIPFSIEKWQEGYEVVCRGGKAPSELHYFRTAKAESRIVAIINGYAYPFYESGLLYVEGPSNSLDLFLRPKMEKWYRRAYWDGHGIAYLTSRDRHVGFLQDNYFAAQNDFTSSDYEWAGPIEGFEVMAREK